jgi:pimeloyl-ACP methyl ester carboxylesterase
LKADLKESKMGLNYIATEPVRQLHKMWNNYFDKSTADSKFLMICHSQGAIHVRNALLDYPEHLRNRIIVVAIAPAGYIYKESCAQVIHYRVPGYRDPIPLYDGDGRSTSKDTTVILDSHEDADLIDHCFQSPTYKGSLKDKIHEYIFK